MTPQANLTILFLGAFALSTHAAEPPPIERPQAEPKEIRPFSVVVTGSGRPMIFIPGLSCGGNVWDGTVAHFKDRYECHVLTLAGFAGQPAIGEPFLEQVRDGLIKYIRDKHLERPIIVGHSLGAFLAFWLGATAPEQIGPIIAVDGMPYFPALLDRSATPQSVTPRADGLRSMLKAQTSAQFAFGQRAFLAGAITDAKDVEKIADGSTKSDPQAVAQAFYEIMTIDLRPKVGAIRTPVLVIGATAAEPNPDQKKVTEGNYRMQVTTIARHKVVFAQKARHFIQLDEPEYLVQEVETFLKETNATAAP